MCSSLKEEESAFPRLKTDGASGRRFAAIACLPAPFFCGAAQRIGNSRAPVDVSYFQTAKFGRVRTGGRHQSCLIRLLEYTLLAFSSLFVIVDPISTVPAFLAMTHHDTPQQRIQMARLACGVMAGVLIGFSLLGKWLFGILGITLPAFQIAGSLVLLLVALDMLRARRSRVQETHEETNAGSEKDDIAVTPLAVPLLAGPGAISTVMLLQNQARDLAQHIALIVCIVTISITSFLVLRFSAHGGRWLNPIAMRITTRLMGLLLAAVACQFMINALKDLKVIPS